MRYLGSWIKQRRKALGLTQKELAQRLGCAVITLKKIEQETRRPSQELAELLVDHLLISGPERQRFLAIARGLGSYRPASTEVGGQDSVSPENAAPGRGPGSPFVARQRELAELHGRLDKALVDQSQIVFITGEAGSGKSTLLTEFARQAQIRHRHLIVAGGRCNAFSGSGDAYLPFRDAMLLLLGEIDGSWARSLSALQPGLHKQLLPIIAHALINLGPDVIDVLVPASILLHRIAAIQPAAAYPWADQLRELILHRQTISTRPDTIQIFEQIRLIIQALSRNQPLLLLLDDLQWADSASLNLHFAR